MPDQALDMIDAAERIDRKHRAQTREKARRVQHLVRHAGFTLVDAAAELGVKVSTATYYSKLVIAEREPSMRRAIVATLLLSGLRASELCALRWRDIDLVNRRITVRGTKSDAADRVVKIVDYLLFELERWKFDAPSTDPDDFVFPTTSGCQRTKDNLLTNVVRPAVREANRVRRLHDLTPLPQRTAPHVLRRTFVKLMLAHGNPPKSVQVEAGHADSRTTLDIYAEELDVTDPVHGRRSLGSVATAGDRGQRRTEDPMLARAEMTSHEAHGHQRRRSRRGH
jgi:integrase